eukprot:TRINITY_DN12385_c0_g1_i1.p1 TRINITY_DN12385_c0_g1~~TRINITY_DN12385_c0_g1_i1.p1  ORF type:complete len:260 (+),score=34.70 TRINITY_DN12385_c0_g1_i1:33-812(+)
MSLPVDPNINTVNQVMGNPLFSYGADTAKNWFSNNMSFASVYLQLLRPYFHVDNSYVTKKLSILLMPFMNKNWNRSLDQNSGYALPTMDVNAPDLYVPTMSFVSYVLLVAIALGATFQFTPDVLGRTATTSLVVVILEVCAIRLSFFLFNFPPINIFDIVAYSGYKFTIAVLCMIIGLLAGNNGFYVAYFLITTLFAIFIIKTLRAEIPRPRTKTGQLMRGYIIVLTAFVQYFWIFFLCYINFDAPIISPDNNLQGNTM